MTGRRFTRSVLTNDTSTTTTAADANTNKNDDTMKVDTDNNNHQPINNNRRTSSHRRSSQTSETTNPILDDMSDIELDLSDAATATATSNDNVRTISEEQVTANDEDDDIDMEIGKLDNDEEQWPSPQSNNATNSSNNDSSPTMAAYQQQYYGGKSADNDKMKSYRISHLQHRISSLESQVSHLSSSNTNSTTNSSTNSSTATGGARAYQPMTPPEEENLKRRISEMEYELQMRRNRTNRLRRLIMDYVTLPSIVMPLEGEGGMSGWEGGMPVLNGEGMHQLGGIGEMPMLNDLQLGIPMLNMEVEGANVVSPIVQMNVTNGGQVDGLDSLPDLPVMNLNDNIEDNASSEGQSGKKRGYAEV